MNKLEQIAAKKKEAELTKQEGEVAKFASRVADEVISTIGEIKADTLKVDIEELARCVAESIVLSNKKFDDQLDTNFGLLLSAVQQNRPDNTDIIKLSSQIAQTLNRLQHNISNLELSPQISVTGLTLDELKKEIDRLIGRLPTDSKRIVTLAYDNVTPDKYLNVRLTDGIDFYKASGKGGGGGGLTNAQLRESPLEVTTTVEPSKPTDVYSIAAISDDGTYKYFFFEDKDLNYYVMRKMKTTSVFQYTKGTGGYSAVYVNSTSGPSGSPTWGTYGATF